MLGKEGRRERVMGERAREGEREREMGKRERDFLKEGDIAKESLRVFHYDIRLPDSILL